jgi:hypothetical protein
LAEVELLRDRERRDAVVVRHRAVDAGEVDMADLITRARQAADAAALPRRARAFACDADRAAGPALRVAHAAKAALTRIEAVVEVELHHRLMKLLDRQQ